MKATSLHTLCAIGLAAILAGCSGSTRQASNTQSLTPVKAVNSVRNAHDQVALLEEATGVPRNVSRVNLMLSDRGAGLNQTGGESESVTFVQSTVEMTAAFCVEAAILAAKNPPEPQKVFPNYVPFGTTPQAVRAKPDTQILTPLARHLLERFSGLDPTPEEIDALVAAMKTYLQQQQDDNNSSTGLQRAWVAACVTAALTAGATLSVQ